MAAYPMASILRPIELPAYGGDTLWANCATAYESLPQSLQRFADALDGIHRSEVDFEGQFQAAIKAHLTHYGKPSNATRLESIHPVVRVHPETGERSLVLGEWFKRFDERELALVVARDVPGQRESFHEIVRR